MPASGLSGERSRRLFYCDQHMFPLPLGHRFPAGKYALLRELLAADGFYELQPAPLADSRTIELAHDPAYVRAFLDGTVDPRMMRRIGLPWSEGLVRRTLASVGGPWRRRAMRWQPASAAASRAAPTMRSATKARASACSTTWPWLFAPLAPGPRSSTWTCTRATAPRVFSKGPTTCSRCPCTPRITSLSASSAATSISRSPTAPATRPTWRGCATLPRVAEFGPAVLFYQSGVDGLEGDRLGRLCLSHAGLMERDREVFEFARDRNIPVVVTLGGGYADPIARTAEAHANTFRTAAAVYRWRRATD